jgi:hypothetical protein
MPTRDHTVLAGVNVSVATWCDGRFSGVHQWLVLGVHRGERQLAQAGTSARLNQHVSGSVSVSLDRVVINGRSTTGSLVISRLNVGVSTRLFANVLVQHNSNSGQWDTNVRVNYIHAPLSDVFVVFSERVTATSHQRDRSIVLKVTRLFAF